MISQRSMVEASLFADEQRQHHHDAPARLRLVPGAERTAGTDDRVAPRVHASGSQEAGRDGCSPTPSRTDVCACGHLRGDHQQSGSRSLAPAALDNALGLCLIAGCACSRWTTVRTVPGTNGRHLA